MKMDLERDVHERELKQVGDDYRVGEGGRGKKEGEYLLPALL